MTLNYSKIFADKHLLYIGLNVDLTQKKYRNYNFVVEGFVEETLDFLSAALQYQENGKPTVSENITRRMGIVGNLNYSFDDRYYVDFAYRTDGSSQFGKDKKFAPFYSAGIGWNIHNEKFMKSVDFIDRLKLRTSYGQTGSQNFSAYQAISTYSYFSSHPYPHSPLTHFHSFPSLFLYLSITPFISILPTIPSPIPTFLSFPT